MKPAVAAFRMHSGWGALVVISGSSANPELIERRRITIIDATAIGAKQPYHFAESLSLPEAENHLRRCADASGDLALKAIGETQTALRTRGYDVVAAAMLLVVFGETLPEANGGFRVVSGAGHVNQTEMVCLGFLQAAVRQLAAEFRPR